MGDFTWDGIQGDGGGGGSGAGIVFLGYAFDTVTSPTVPGTVSAGKLRFDNATPSAVTMIFINETDEEGTMRGPEIATWDDSASFAPAVIWFRSRTSPGDYASYFVTAANVDSGSYDRITVTHRASNGTFSDGESLAVFFSPPSDVATGYQPLDADLTAIAALSSATDKLPYATGVAAWALASFTAFGRSLVAAANDAAARTVLGLGSLATQSGTFSGTSSGTNTGDQTVTLTSDVTGSGTGSFATTIANDAVTYAKIQNVSATDKLLGRSTAGAGDVEEIACTAAGRALIDDADAATQRTTLGIDTLYAQFWEGLGPVTTGSYGAAVRSTVSFPAHGGITLTGSTSTRIGTVVRPVGGGGDRTHIMRVRVCDHDLGHAGIAMTVASVDDPHIWIKVIASGLLHRGVEVLTVPTFTSIAAGRVAPHAWRSITAAGAGARSHAVYRSQDASSWELIDTVTKDVEGTGLGVINEGAANLAVPQVHCDAELVT